MPHISINGNRLVVERGGAGMPIVLVHGSWTGRMVWNTVAGILRERFDVTAYDRLGYNDSDRPDIAYTRRRHEDDLIALIEHLDAGPVALLGNSYGGAISLGVAGRRPDLVTDVAAHEPALIDLADTPAVREVRATFLEVGQMIDAGDHEAAAKRFFEEVALGPGAWDIVPDVFRQLAVHNAATFANEKNDPRWVALDRLGIARYTGRILLTQGSESLQWFHDVMDAVGAAIPYAQRRVLEGATHSPHSTHPEQYAALLTSWLRQDVSLAA